MQFKTHHGFLALILLLSTPCLCQTLEKNKCPDALRVVGIHQSRDYAVHFKETDEGYTASDPNDPRFPLTVRYDEREMGVYFHIRTKIREGATVIASKTMKGAIEFDEMMAYFRRKNYPIRFIQGAWDNERSSETTLPDKDNLDSFNKYTGPPHNLSLEEAAKKTWTGIQAARHGYTRVNIREPMGSPGNYRQVKVYFKKPE